MEHRPQHAYGGLLKLAKADNMDVCAWSQIILCTLAGRKVGIGFSEGPLKPIAERSVLPVASQHLIITK